MGTKRTAASFGLVLAFASAARVEELREADADRDAVVRGGNQFACSLYAKLASEAGNLFFSPFSVSEALAMTAGGARGETLAGMSKALALPEDPAQVQRGWRSLHATLLGKSASKKYELSVANALWGQKGVAFHAPFVEGAAATFGATLRELDFRGAAAKSRDTINDWVAGQTHDRIRDLLPTDAVHRETKLVLTNAIYFKAAWDEQFTKRATEKGDFLLHDGGKKAGVDLMRQSHDFHYFDGGSFQHAELPYEGHELAMLILLPKEIGGLPEFEKSLSPELLARCRREQANHDVALTLPRFKITSMAMLQAPLIELGMDRAFSDHADFSGMSAQEALKIDAVVHKAFVDVNEEGTEAAAATAVTMALASAPPPLPKAEFRADHPFLFLITHRATGAILFAGRLQSP